MLYIYHLWLHAGLAASVTYARRHCV